MQPLPTHHGRDPELADAPLFSCAHGTLAACSPSAAIRAWLCLFTLVNENKDNLEMQAQRRPHRRIAGGQSPWEFAKTKPVACLSIAAGWLLRSASVGSRCQAAILRLAASDSVSAHVCCEQSFGAFMIYEWRKGGETQAHAVPGYIFLILGLGGAGSISNALSYIGACSRSVCLMSTSLCVMLCVLLLEIALCAVLFYAPSMVDTKVCPPDDAACLARVDSIFKDPSAHAGCRTPCNSSWRCPCNCLL